ncbi:MAG TPA: peptidylprolyl isomerase [Anaerolineae bacterium]
MSKFRFLTLVTVLAVVVLGAACTPKAAPQPAPSSATPQAAAATTAPVAATAVKAENALPTAAPISAAQTPAAPDKRPLVPTPPADNSRPLAKTPVAQRADAFSGPAAQSISADAVYVATIVTSKGNIVAELYKDTPLSANNFVTLAKDGFYDGMTFHRVEAGFVIQGGDPLGTGAGGPGYTIPAEIKHQHIKGALAWARTSDQVNPQRASSGSQFYITLDNVSQLDGAYTVFGQVIQGQDVVDKIAVGDAIKEIDISQAQASQMPTPLPPTPTREPKAPAPAEGRPLATLSPDQRDRYYTQPPAMSINPAKTYQATITTAKGKIVLDLDPKTAPNAVNSFVVLANLGFYDGLPVAFVQPGGYAVLGSPKSREDSDAGYVLKPEGPTPAAVITGTMSLYPTANQATGTYMADGSQFLLWLAAPPPLDVPLSVMGKVSSGQDVVEKLAAGDKIDKIEVTEK